MTILKEMTREYNRYTSFNEHTPKYLVMTMDKYNDFKSYVDTLRNLRVGYEIDYFQGALILPTAGANGSLIKAFS